MFSVNSINPAVLKHSVIGAVLIWVSKTPNYHRLQTNVHGSLFVGRSAVRKPVVVVCLFCSPFKRRKGDDNAMHVANKERNRSIVESLTISATTSWTACWLLEEDESSFTHKETKHKSGVNLKIAQSYTVNQWIYRTWCLWIAIITDEHVLRTQTHRN